LLKIMEMLPTVKETECLYSMILTECRLLYENRPLVELITEKKSKEFAEAHKAAKSHSDLKVKQASSDVLQMVEK